MSKMLYNSPTSISKNFPGVIPPDPAKRGRGGAERKGRGGKRRKGSGGREGRGIVQL